MARNLKTRKVSKKPIIKPKIINFKGKRTLGGLIFPTPGHFNSIYAWAEAGSPNNVYIVDTIDNHISAGIPIVDAVIIRGVYVKIRKGKPQECSVNTVYAPYAVLAVAHTTVDGIKDANTQKHHTLYY